MSAIEPDLVQALGHVVNVMACAGVRYALIGGIAKAAWGRARATRNIDIAISVDALALEDLQARLIAGGFGVTDSVGGDIGDARPDIFVARSPSGVPVDILS